MQTVLCKTPPAALICSSPRRQKSRCPVGHLLAQRLATGLVAIALPARCIVSLGQSLASHMPPACGIESFESPASKKQMPGWASAYGVARYGTRCHRAARAMCSFARSSTREPHATGMWHWIVRVPDVKKSRYPFGYRLFWWLARDSNPGPTP